MILDFRYERQINLIITRGILQVVLFINRREKFYQ